MDNKPTSKIEEHFGKVTDPRIGNAKRHTLLDIIVIAILAIICGADGWADVELFAKSKEKWLKTFLGLPHGIPSHDTFGRVFAKINPVEFEAGFMSWVETIQSLTQGEVIAVDGKQLRGSAEIGNGQAAMNIVSAWATANELVLGEVSVEEKSNEITAIPKLLQLLDLTGCLITVDAIGTQREIAEQIIHQGGDYLFAVKENQGQLYEDLDLLFSVDQADGFRASGYSHARRVNKNHGRLEIREAWAISEEAYVDFVRSRLRWKGMQTVGMIVSERRLREKSEIKTRYYLSSRRLDAKALLKAKRSHWGIENKLHWVLDIAFDEDHCRVRKDHAPENFAIMRHMALNMLKQETTVKAGIHAKRKKAGWDEEYLLKVLSI